MSKILISYVQTIIDDNQQNLLCYYDSLSKELTKLGNEVLFLNIINSFFPFKNDNKKFIKESVEKVKEFNPDIIFSFNNHIFEEIIKETDCPIILFEADLSDLFANIEFIKKYKERYFMVTFFPEYVPLYRDLGFDENKILLLHPVTSIKAEKKEKENNISFIGSSFQPPMTMTINNILENNNKNLYKLYREFWNENNYYSQSLINKYLKDFAINKVEFYSILDSRTYVLQSVLDLGLKLYGVGWENLSTVLTPLISAFDRTPVYSLKQNQDVYNSSVINLSISHPQCEGYAFPWRTYDIMASDGVLVTSYSKALQDYTKGYVDIPMYKSPYDARDLCKKILKEENLRKDIIAASNAFIEKHGRWDDNFVKIQNSTNVKIIQKDAKIGNVDFIKGEYLLKTNEIKPMVKSIFYGTVYSIMHYPVLYQLSSKEFRDKIYKAMIKYNKELLYYMKRNL